MVRSTTRTGALKSSAPPVSPASVKAMSLRRIRFAQNSASARAQPTSSAIAGRASKIHRNSRIERPDRNISIGSSTLLLLNFYLRPLITLHPVEELIDLRLILIQPLLRLRRFQFLEDVVS